jgi:integrating conjugative element protein (TIGR03755 family)
MDYGYSCGRFDFRNNLEDIVNNYMTQIQQIPSQLVGAVTSAIAGLPSYVLMKANASLYNNLQKILDDSTDLFRLSYKSCEMMEAELRKDSDANPYQGFIRASIMDKWRYGAQNNQTITDTHDDIKNDPADPIVWFGGHLAGIPSNPIQINRDLVIAGYNILLGRTADVSTVSAPTGIAADQPIAQIWPNPAEAGRWVQEVLGDQILILENPPLNPETIPGKGLRPLVAELELEIHDAIMEIYEHNNFDLMTHYISLPSISGKLAEGLRTLPQAEVLVIMDRLVSEMAVKEAKERLLLIRQMITTALKAPDLLASPDAGAEAIKYVNANTAPRIRDALEEVVTELELQHRSINPTMLMVLDRAEALRQSGRAKQSGTVRREQRVQ